MATNATKKGLIAGGFVLLFGKRPAGFFKNEDLNLMFDGKPLRIETNEGGDGLSASFTKGTKVEVQLKAQNIDKELLTVLFQNFVSNNTSSTDPSVGKVQIKSIPGQRVQTFPVTIYLNCSDELVTLYPNDATNPWAFQMKLASVQSNANIAYGVNSTANFDLTLEGEIDYDNDNLVAELGTGISLPNSSIYAVQITNGGVGYVSAPTLTATGVTGFVATAVLTSGVVTKVIVTAKGTGWATGSTISVSGGTPTTPATFRPVIL